MVGSRLIFWLRFIYPCGGPKQVCHGSSVLPPSATWYSRWLTCTGVPESNSARECSRHGGVVKKLEIATNSAVLLVALLGSVVLVRDLMTPSAVRSTPDSQSYQSDGETLVGKRMVLPGVKWNSGRPTLVMALATYCHFCIESTGFYHDVPQATRSHEAKVNVVAAFPQDQKIAQDFDLNSGLAAYCFLRRYRRWHSSRMPTRSPSSMRAKLLRWTCSGRNRIGPC